MPEPGTQERDYYSLLGVAHDALPDVIRQAFHRFARTYHPDNFGAAEVDRRQLAERLYRRGTEAYRVLMNPDKRRLYDEGLERGQLRYAADRTKESRPPGSGPEIRSPKARTFYSSALTALAAGNLAQAKLNLQMALRHDPDNEMLQAELEKVKAQGKK